MKIGSIYYTLRTKKPLKDAKAAYDTTKEGALDRYAPSNEGIYLIYKKIVENVVESGSNIKVKNYRNGDMVAPFYSYEFYEW